MKFVCDVHIYLIHILYIYGWDHRVDDKVMNLYLTVSHAAYAEHLANYFAIFSERGGQLFCRYFPSHYSIEHNITLNGVEMLNKGQWQLIYACFTL